MHWEINFFYIGLWNCGRLKVLKNKLYGFWTLRLLIAVILKPMPGGHKRLARPETVAREILIKLAKFGPRQGLLWSGMKM